MDAEADKALKEKVDVAHFGCSMLVVILALTTLALFTVQKVSELRDRVTALEEKVK